MAALKILVIPGSLRTGSLNAKLRRNCRARAVAGRRRGDAHFAVGFSAADLRRRSAGKSGIPKNAVNLKRMMGTHHGVLIVTPEYNSSVPALVKNTIDWISRVQDPHETRGQVFRDRAFAIAAASGNRLGGTRALAALRTDPDRLPRRRRAEPARAVVCEEAYDDKGSPEERRRYRSAQCHGAAVIEFSQRMM
jgi:NAD(P)H-dependent FMN reductase